MLFNLEPQVLIILVFCLIFALTFHEFGHAFVAHLCGDDTAKMEGRMSLNPLVHLDFVGSLMLFMVGFGYAKPVPVNSRNYRVRNADFYVASAGPAMNLILGLAGALVFHMLARNEMMFFAGIEMQELLFWFMFINFNLCFFNLIPLGPLDGNSVFPHFLPNDMKLKFQYWNNKYGSQALMALVLLSMVMPSFSAFRWITNLSKYLIGLL